MRGDPAARPPGSLTGNERFRRRLPALVKPPTEPDGETVVSLKILLAGAAALAITAGLMLPLPHAERPPQRSQIATLSVDR
jgi:hypothetical protein